jgi:hypothetical protein
MTIINKYTNGNTEVTIHSDGTKIREYSDSPFVDHPESIDVKITNYCDMGCNFCHESSTKEGKHGDLVRLLEIIKPLPAGVELAIGGGNPLDHPDLVPFLFQLRYRGIIANLTVNQGHLKEHYDLLAYLIEDNLVKGIGISIANNNFKYVRKLKTLTDNIVYHVIAGVNDVRIMDNLIGIGNCKVLVLGYKQFGFGVAYYNDAVEDNIKKWYMYLPLYIVKCVISFDNLAIEQLNVKRLLTQDGWSKFYMGDDFTYSMYISAVDQQYAPTSRSSERVRFGEMPLLEYFKKYRNEYEKV